MIMYYIIENIGTLSALRWDYTDKSHAVSVYTAPQYVARATEQWAPAW